MEIIQLEDINIMDIGVKYMMLGQLWVGPDDSFIALLPETNDIIEPKLLTLDTSEWEKILFQMDVIETEIFKKDPTGKLVKAIVRRSTRTIDAFVTWKVYKRDNYSCRYCGVNGVPMTVDHIDLWEDGGPSTEENLLTACKKCNKDRGNIHYEDWIVSDKYLIKSKNLTQEQKQANLDIIQRLPELRAKRFTNVRSR